MGLLDPRKWLILLELRENLGQNGNELRKSLGRKFVSFAFLAHEARNLLYNWLHQLREQGLIVESLFGCRRFPFEEGIET